MNTISCIQNFVFVSGECSSNMVAGTYFRRRYYLNYKKEIISWILVNFNGWFSELSCILVNLHRFYRCFMDSDEISWFCNAFTLIFANLHAHKLMLKKLFFENETKTQQHTHGSCA